jgi:hypothetical protein
MTKNQAIGLAAAATMGILGLIAGCGEDSPSTSQGESPKNRKITFNGVALTRSGLASWEELEVRGNFHLPDGSYWYDIATGAAGAWGGPTVAFLPAGLQFCGAMPANCSGGDTRVFVNGRELHPNDVAAIRKLTGGVAIAGHYWMDAMGNFGKEGGAIMGNIVLLARSASGRGNGTSSHYLNDGAGTRISVGGFGNGDYYYSDSTGNSWWPGK